MKKELIENYKLNGYVHLKKVFADGFCDLMVDKIENYLEPKVYIPFTKIPWGFGQLFEVEPFNKVIEKKEITDLCSSIFNNKNYSYNHLMVSNKAPFLGPEEMYHQEVSNIDTYAPGCNPNIDWENFLQIFIPVDNQTLENGCLRVIPKSHNLGFLEHEDIVWNNHGHKRRLSNKSMMRAYKEYGIVNLELSRGDVLIFNHLLIHGANSNQSPKNRRSIICQAQNTKIDKDVAVFNKEAVYRSNFIIKTYEEKIKSVKENNIYKDFLNKKK